jgi:hypothetical protein
MLPSLPIDQQLAHHRYMNRQTWQRLVANEVAEDTEVQLDFYFDAQSKEKASALKDHLQREKGYEATLIPVGPLLHRSWSL